MQLNLTYYTKTSYFKCFPQATEKDYLNYLANDDYEVMKQMEEKIGREITQVRKVFIDKEYFDWLKKTGKENTSENRLDFMNCLTDEDVKKMWDKYNNNQDWTVEVYAIPFVITTVSAGLGPKGSIEVSKSVLNKLRNEISKRCIVNQNHVLMHPELIQGDYFFNEFEEVFEEKAEKFFATGGEYNLKTKVSMVANNKKHANLVFRFLPVAIRFEDKAIMTTKDLEREDKREFAFKERFINSVAKEIQKQMRFTMVVGFEDPIEVMDIPDFMDEFIGGFVKMGDGKNIKFV